MANNINDVVKCFEIDPGCHAPVPFGNGLINDSYLVKNTCPTGPDYILQRINHNVFRDVEKLQQNIRAVTGHIRSKLAENGTPDIDRRVLRLVGTTDGKDYHFDGDSYWRMMYYIPGSVTYETVDPRLARCTGEAFGEFQYMLSDIGVPLWETIPRFHDIEFRLEQLAGAVAADPFGKVGEVRELLDELEQRADKMCFAEKLHREGKLVKRVCHCDTKVNNVLFDTDGNILCVIDLDTVMPSYVFSDYGDFIRTGCNTGLEDDPDPGKVGLDIDIFTSFTEGYLGSASRFLTETEIEYLPMAPLLFAYMQTVRFLADHINGSIYYKTAYPEHNLVRSNAQFALLQNMEKNFDTIKSCVEKNR